MDVTVREAREKLDELLDKAEAGEEILVTREGRPSVRLVAEGKSSRPRFRRDVIDEITRRAVLEALPGPDAAHSQDFLYDEFGLPS